MSDRSLDGMEHVFESTLRSRFGGVLTSGKHCPDGRACALECAAVARELPWTDDPAEVGLPDLRMMNDKYADDTRRTAALVPLVIALWSWQWWTPEQRKAWAVRIAERTIREVLPIALRAAKLNDAADRCEKEGTADAARAASAASSAATYAALYAASDAATDARSAAAAAAYAAADAATYASSDARHPVMDLACRIWREEADRAVTQPAGGQR